MFAALRGRRLGDWSVSLRGYVTAAMLVVLLPLLGHAVVVTWTSYATSREWAERDLLDDAEHLAEDIDVRLDVARAVMQLVSTSSAALRGDAEAVGQMLEAARIAGLVRAAVVTDPAGAVVLSAGVGPGPGAGIAGPEGSPQFLAGRLEGGAVLAAAWPIGSADPRLARLAFAVPAGVLHGAKSRQGEGAWHVTAVIDRRGEAAWVEASALGAALLRQTLDPAATAGVMQGWSAPDGSVHTIGFARAPRSGLTVMVAQPSPGLYERVPFGPMGAAAIAAGVALLSVVLARLGAVQIHAAYRAATGGAPGGRVRIRDAMRLGTELRNTRDRLFQAAGGIAMVEMTRPPGRGWAEAEVAASDSIRALLALAPGEALTAGRLLGALSREDRAALGAALAEVEAGEAGVFTRLVRSVEADRAPRFFNVVGMLRAPVTDMAAQLVLTVQDVTAQKEAEREAQAQASRLRLATEIAGLGVWEGNAERGTGHASERMWEIMGREPGGRLDRETFLRDVHPDDRARVAASTGREPPGAPAGPSAPLRFRLVRPDGSVRHVRSNRIYVDDGSGAGRLKVGVLFDETETVMAQRALAASEARFRLAVEVAELGVFERRIDPYRNEGVWNERMWRIRGLEPRSEPMGYDEMVAMIHPEDRPRVVAAMHERRTGEDGASDFEFRLIRPDGEERIIQSRSVRTEYPEEQASSIVAINLDVTERRRAEQELREAAARFRLAVETAGLGFAQLDVATGKGMWSDRLFAISGLEPGERPTLEQVLARVHPDDRARVAGAMARQRFDDEGAVTEEEFRIFRPDGQERVVHVHSMKLRRADGTETLSTVTQDVTEQRRAQHALAASEARLRLAVETAGLGVAELDTASGVGLWNERLYRICGLDPAGARPSMDAVFAMIHPDDRAGVTAALAAQRAGEPGGVADYDMRIVRPDGEERSLHMRSALLRPAGGQELLLTVTHDITEQRLAERRLAESEARLRLAVETAGLGVSDRNLTTGEGSWSGQLYRIMGMEADDRQLGSSETLTLVHPEDRGVVEGVWARHADAEDGFVSEYDYRMLRPDGQERILHARSVTLRGADGTVRLLSVNQDVTEQRAAEQALAASELRLRLTAEAAGVGIWDHDPATGTTFWSEQMFRLRGLEGEGRAPTREFITEHTLEEDRPVLLGAWDRLTSGEAALGFEYRAVWPNGTVRWLHSEGRTLRDAQGRVVRMLGMVTDTTDKREAELALMDRTTMLELAIEAAEFGIWTREPNEMTRQASARMWAMLGHPGREGSMTREELVGCLHPDDREAVLSAWVPADGQTAPRQLRDFRAVWPDGTVRHFQSRRAVMRDAAGRTVRVIGLIADVTEARQAAAALAASEARLRLAVEAAELGVFDYDPETRDGYWSERTWRMRGLEPRADFPSLAEIVATLHADDRAGSVAKAQVHHAGRDGDRIEHEFRVVWPDGTLRHLQMRALLHRGEDGRARVFGINMDVTERRTAALALATSETRLRLAVEAAELGVFDYDPDTREGYWSERTWRMRGLEPREGVPSLAEVAAAVHPDDRERSAARTQAQFSGADGTRIDNEFRVVWPDGTVRHLLLRAVLHRDPDGRARVFGINMDVTERRTAALALEASEARLRLAVDAAEMGVFEFDPASGTRFWSDRVWRMRGVEPRPGAPGYKEAMAMIHPADREAVAAAMRLPPDGAGPARHEHEFRVVRPDGAVRHIHALVVVERHEDGGPGRIFGVNLDITEQVEREQALREAAARFELAIDAAGLAVWNWDPDTDRMTWSPRIWEIMGLEPQGEVPFLEIRQRVVHPEDRDSVPMAWIRAVSGGEERRGQGEFRVVRKDGSIRYLHWQGIPLRDGEGLILRFAGVLADVTEARLSELALRTSEELFRMAAEAAEQGVWDHDLASGALSWSALLWRIHGLAPGEGAPPPEACFEAIHPEDRAEVLALPQELAAEAANTVMRRSYRIVRPDGAVRTLEQQAMLLAGADGRPARIVGVVRDVTEARELAAQTMVADKLATLGEMAGAIAHELSQPLQAVMATAATARMRLTRDAEEATVERVRDRLAWIERQTSRAGKTIQHLLAFSRGESSDGITLLAAALEGAMELAGYGLRHSAIEVSVALPEDLPPVRGGQVEIEQVLVNLLNNARDAMADRPVRQIRIEGRRDGELVRLDVTDTGGGVPADKLERIFEPFYTTKPVGRGTGIGLSVARRTMRALDGAITVANTGEGACFSLAFRSALPEG